MRLRNQVLLIVLATLFLTVGLLVGYYNLFLSSSTAHEFEQLQASLEVQCASYADHLPLESDFSRYLQQQADATGYQFHLLDLDGRTLYRTEAVSYTHLLPRHQKQARRWPCRRPQPKFSA